MPALNRLDQLILGLDRGLRTLFAPAPTERPMPGEDLPEGDLSDGERQHAHRLLRVDHSGEVCAQALYQGQALTARDPGARDALSRAAWEEVEHLNWTERRIAELGGRKSFLNPVWYVGSLAIGVTAGVIGDRWNLGFLAETERQVVRHLDSHLRSLPEQDARSRAIVARMKDDEERHATMAVHHGAAELPLPVKGAMRLMARVMTSTVYRL